MKKLLFILSLVFATTVSFANNLGEDVNATEGAEVRAYPTISGWCGSGSYECNFVGSLIDVASNSSSATILLSSPEFEEWTVTSSNSFGVIVSENASQGYIQIRTSDGRALAGLVGVDIEGTLTTGETITIGLSFRGVTVN